MSMTLSSRWNSGWRFCVPNSWKRYIAESCKCAPCAIYCGKPVLLIGKQKSMWADETSCFIYFCLFTFRIGKHWPDDGLQFWNLGESAWLSVPGVCEYHYCILKLYWWAREFSSSGGEGVLVVSGSRSGTGLTGMTVSSKHWCFGEHVTELYSVAASCFVG